MLIPERDISNRDKEGNGLNIQHLEYVLAVYKHGSINKAAKVCYISQSHLSRIIKDLEEELGFELISRSSKGLTFNRNGLYFIDSATKIVEESKKIQRIPKIVNESGSMHIVSSPTAFLMQGFLAFRNPRSSMNQTSTDVFKECDLNEIMQQVISREAPLGLMALFERMLPKYQAAAERFQLSLDLVEGDIPVLAMMSRQHPLALKETLTREDLEGYPFVLNANVDYDDTLAGVLKLKKSPHTLLVSNRASLMDAIQSGRFLCHSAGIAIDGLPDVCARSIEDVTETMAIYTVKSADREYSARERDLIAFLKSWVQNHRRITE